MEHDQVSVTVIALGGRVRPEDRWMLERWRELIEGGIEPHLAHDLAAVEARERAKRQS